MTSAQPPAEAPLLSVVVPVHCVEDYLAQCLDSILAGRDSGVEVIAVDDRSPDRSGAMLDDYARRDPRVRVVHLDRNVGLGPARNVGLAHAAGDYAWFVDSDDWLPDGSVAAVLERLRATRPDVLIVGHAEVFAGGRVVPAGDGGMLRDPVTPMRLAQRPGLLRLAQSACTKVVRRSLLDEIDLRFFSGWYEDSAFTYPLLMAAGRLDLLQRVCYCYRQRSGGGITKTRSPRHFEVFDQYERLFQFVDKAAPAYDEFRPELFRLMINHYLVIVGNERRIPPRMRREFFRRAAADYRRWAPPGGYEMPRGAWGIKHRLVRRDAYLTYAALRSAHWMSSGRWLRFRRRFTV
jgi:CDP-glycerol glycerophosphotransferase